MTCCWPRSITPLRRYLRAGLCRRRADHRTGPTQRPGAGRRRQPSGAVGSPQPHRAPVQCRHPVDAAARAVADRGEVRPDRAAPGRLPPRPGRLGIAGDRGAQQPGKRRHRAGLPPPARFAERILDTKTLHGILDSILGLSRQAQVTDSGSPSTSGRTGPRCPATEVERSVAGGLLRFFDLPAGTVGALDELVEHRADHLRKPAELDRDAEPLRGHAH